MKVCPSCHSGALTQADTCPVCSTPLSSAHYHNGSELEGMIVDQKYQLCAMWYRVGALTSELNVLDSAIQYLHPLYQAL